MTNLTVRNIPDEILRRIKILSEIEKRSLNNEILILLEKGLFNEIYSKKSRNISKETQIKIWEKLSGLWEDKRSTENIINDIYSTRTIGRDTEL